MTNIYPTIYLTPISFEKTLESGGRTKPIIVRIKTNDNTETDQYVVKLYGNNELGHHSSLREMLGAKMAIYFDIKSPLPAVMEITTDFVNLAVPGNQKLTLENSCGYNYSSTYILGAKIYQNSSLLLKEYQNQALAIFAFDLLLCNYDRRSERPNLFFDDNGFIVYDHEMAFPYSKPISMMNNIPDFKNCFEFRYSFQNHILYNELKRHNNFNIEPFLEKLSSFTNSVFDDMLHGLPKDWLSDDIEHIRKFIIKTKQNINDFKRCYLEVFA